MRNFRLQLAHRLLTDTTSRSHTANLQRRGEGEGRGGAGDQCRGRGPLAAGPPPGVGRTGSRQGSDPAAGAQSKRGKGRIQQQRSSAGPSPVGRREADTRTRGGIQDHADPPTILRNHPNLNDPDRLKSSNSSTAMSSTTSDLRTVTQRTLTALWTPKTTDKMQPARFAAGGRKPVRHSNIICGTSTTKKETNSSRERGTRG